MLFLECPELLVPVVNFLKKFILPILQVGVPIFLIIVGMIDFGKGVVASKEDSMKKGQKAFVRRLMAAVSFFLVTTIVTLGMDILGNAKISGADLWRECWGNQKEEVNNSTPSIEEQCSIYTGEDYGKCVTERKERQAQCKNTCDLKYPSGGQDYANCMVTCDQ